MYTGVVLPLGWVGGVHFEDRKTIEKNGNQSKERD
jgi:hypothetical protein